LKKLTKDLRALYVKQMKLKEDERKVIAKEIHDVMGQNLTGIKMDAVWILKNIESANKEELKERAEQLKQITEDTVQSSLQLYTHLYPQMLEEVGLVGAIRWNNKTLLRNFKMNVKFNTDLEEEELFPDNPYICLALYRIYQECLTNIIRYAEAENVSIDLFVEEGEIVLSVKDDGIGFEIDKVDTITHHGLIGIRERVHALNGKLVINSQLGKGTITTVSIPLPKEDD
ncbi:MAG: sensor histidine kinase, partial [Bacteroidota bacterium]